MKKIFILLVSLPILLMSCSKNPTSDFTASPSLVGIDETVYFTNRSFDAESFEWDFGDGSPITTRFSTSHSYIMDGDYNVTLKAYINGRVDISSMTIRVIGASLEVTVEEYYDPIRVENSRVRLYPTITDWENQTNLYAEGFTNSAGRVLFNHLAAQRFYVDVYDQYHDNLQLAAEQGGVKWIETPNLVLETITYFTAFVDYYPPAAGKKSFISTAGIKIPRITNSPEIAPRIKAVNK
jgi:PKD repeat protein